MEDNEEEEDDNNIPNCVMGQAFADTLMEDADEEEIPEDDHVDDLGQVLKMHKGTTKMIIKRQSCSIR
jgi:hypothetical protein